MKKSPPATAEFLSFLLLFVLLLTVVVVEARQFHEVYWTTETYCYVYEAPEGPHTVTVHYTAVKTTNLMGEEKRLSEHGQHPKVLEAGNKKLKVSEEQKQKKRAEVGGGDDDEEYWDGSLRMRVYHDKALYKWTGLRDEDVKTGGYKWTDELSRSSNIYSDRSAHDAPQRLAEDSYHFMTHKGGRFDICLRYDSPKRLIANMIVNIYTSIDVNVEEQPATRDQEKDVQTVEYLNALRLVEASVANAKMWSIGARARQVGFEHTASNTYGRIVLFTVINGSILFLAAVWQVMHLRRFFTEKKLV